MSRIVVGFENEDLIIRKVRAKQSDKDVQIINLVDIPYDRVCKSKISLSNSEQKNEILLLKIIPNDLFKEIKIKKAIKAEKNEKELIQIEEKYQKDIQAGTFLRSAVVAYTRNGKIYYYYGKLEKIYKKFIKLKYKVMQLKLNKKGLSFYMFAYFINMYNLDFVDTQFKMNDIISKAVKIDAFEKRISKLKLLTCGFKVKVPMEELKNPEVPINNNFKISIKVGDEEVLYSFGKKDKKIKNKRYYYCPVKKLISQEFAYHVRRTRDGNYCLVKRLKESIEDSIKFKFLESNIVSNILYRFGRECKKLRSLITKRKVNLFYEKFASKSEEGVFEFCQKCNKNKTSSNYFIIDKNSEDYDRIKMYKNVVKKYSLKYYNLIYKCDAFISSESPSHINILRSNNKYLRKAMYQKDFIFLQHGVTYLKAHEANSPFKKGKESAPTYIVVGSEKESDVVSDMMGLKEENILNTGLPVFDTIEYKHINQNSDDIIAVMLTWKPYEEYLYDFKESTYYKSIVEINNMLSKYISKDNIIIIPHPKIFELLSNTDMIENVWQGKISEVLAKTKLLITDYSSVCYNSFYQGAGVVFYQPDIDFYENNNGNLVPEDDEYIGVRTFDIDQLEGVIARCIRNGQIDLEKIRTEEFERRYLSINEFHDGKNNDRIYEKLLELHLI